MTVNLTKSGMDCWICVALRYHQPWKSAPYGSSWELVSVAAGQRLHRGVRQRKAGDPSGDGHLRCVHGHSCRGRSRGLRVGKCGPSRLCCRRCQRRQVLGGRPQRHNLTGWADRRGYQHVALPRRHKSCVVTGLDRGQCHHRRTPCRIPLLTLLSPVVVHRRIRSRLRLRGPLYLRQRSRRGRGWLQVGSAGAAAVVVRGRGGDLWNRPSMP